MLDSIRSFFDSSLAPPAEDKDLDIKDLRLAACSLLIELAYADDDFTEDERSHLTLAVQSQYGLDKDDAGLLIKLAELEHREAVDLYQFTRLIKNNYSLNQKILLAEIMCGLVYADGDLSNHEESLLRKVCNLLDLSPGYLADAKRRVEKNIDP